MQSDSLPREEGCCFQGKSSLDSQSGGLTVMVIFKYKFSETVTTTTE